MMCTISIANTTAPFQALWDAVMHAYIIHIKSKFIV